jgi:hypothetical protein
VCDFESGTIVASIKYPAYMRLELPVEINSFVYLFMLPLIGSLARGEKMGLAWRQPDFNYPFNFIV